jgi:hypothetical protein
MLDIFLQMARLLILFLPKYQFQKAVIKIDKFSNFMGVSDVEFEGFKLQKSMSQVMFESVPLSVFNILLLTKTFEMKEI